jgi:CBS domain-containing protein
MPKTARDVMRTHVLTLSPEALLTDVQRLFHEESIHGAPVVDEVGQVVGVLSSGDLLRVAAEGNDVAPTEPTHYRNDLDLSHFEWERAPADLSAQFGEATVADAMTSGVVDVSPDTPVADVARCMVECRIHRVVVVEEGKLCGLVSTFDLVGLLAEG